MVGLKINNIQASLSPKASLNFIINAKFWDLDFMKGNRTFNFKLPADKINQKLFNFPEDIPNANKEIFKEYAAQITFFGDTLYTGTFKLKSATAEYYEGFFKFEAADIAQFGDISIRQILKNEIHTFADRAIITGLTPYTGADSNIVFPTCKFGNDLFNRFGGLFYDYPFDFKDGTFIAFLKLHYVISLIFNNIGYKIQNPQWHTTYPDVSKITVWNNKELDMNVVAVESILPYDSNLPFYAGYGFTDNQLTLESVELPEKLRLADLVPDMSVRNFLNTVRKLLALHFAFDNKFKTVKISFLKDIFTQNTYKDWTKKANPNHEVEEINYKGIEFSFKKDSKDNYQKDQKEPEKTLQKLADAQTLGIIDLFNFGHPPDSYRFYLEENKYYYVQKLATGDSMRLYLADFLNLSIGDEASQKIQIDCSPVPKSRFLKFKLKEPYASARDKGNGKIRLYLDNNLSGKNGYYLVTKAQNMPANAFDSFQDTPNTIDNPLYIDTEFDYVKDEDGVQLTRVWRTDPILECDAPMTRKLLNIENPDFAFRVFFYHGLQQKKDSELTYPYASPDNLSPRGNKIAEFSLRFDNEGIVNYFYKEYLNFIQYSNIYNFTIYLNFEDLLKFKATDIIRINESNFVVENIDVDISNRVEPAKVTLRKLVSGALQTAQKQTITTIYQTDCTERQTISTIYQIDCD